MGQLERYGLYVLVVVIFLILGVAIMGSDPAAPRGDLAVANEGGAAPDLRAFQPVPTSEQLGKLFGPGGTGAFTEPEPEPKQVPSVAETPKDPPKEPSTRSAVIPSVGSERQGTETAPPPEPRGARTYVVRRGDSYAKIAREQWGNEGLYRRLMAANPATPPDALKPGMEIVIPAIAVEAAGPAAADPAEAAGATIHTVQKGEILGTIAKRYYGRATEWRRIADANPEVDPTRMTPGTRLVIPPRD